ncbi:hypothetical protein J6590_035303 [Homalodisca vitripennis]|nr:hypothetical protein J6590_035303 [Homalodisca vitripennis]
MDHEELNIHWCGISRVAGLSLSFPLQECGNHMNQLYLFSEHTQHPFLARKGQKCLENNSKGIALAEHCSHKPGVEEVIQVPLVVFGLQFLLRSFLEVLSSLGHHLLGNYHVDDISGAACVSNESSLSTCQLTQETSQKYTNSSLMFTISRQSLGVINSKIETTQKTPWFLEHHEPMDVLMLSADIRIERRTLVILGAAGRRKVTKDQSSTRDLSDRTFVSESPGRVWRRKDNQQFGQVKRTKTSKRSKKTLATNTTARHLHRSSSSKSLTLAPKHDPQSNRESVPEKRQS